jgi:uncharacterized small protein (DUF1192 family)
MDIEDILPKRKGDPLAQVVREDLDRLSVEELRERILLLEAELKRVSTKLEGATSFKSAAAALFKK